MTQLGDRTLGSELHKNLHLAAWVMCSPREGLWKNFVLCFLIWAEMLLTYENNTLQWITWLGGR